MSFLRQCFLNIIHRYLSRYHVNCEEFRTSLDAVNTVHIHSKQPQQIIMNRTTDLRFAKSQHEHAQMLLFSSMRSPFMQGFNAVVQSDVPMTGVNGLLYVAHSC